jgi:ADP-ribose pyrophosphatase YjhB (NUDIX family)
LTADDYRHVLQQARGGTLRLLYVAPERFQNERFRELIERMKQAAAAEQTRRELKEKTGLQDPELLNDLQELGFTPDTIQLLPIIPILQVAWAEGGVSAAERKLIVELARARGIAADSAADRQLNEWLERRPSNDVFISATRLVRAMLDQPAQAIGDLSADDVIKYSESIASASGGLFGIGKISAEERATLTQIASALKKR